ncbi:MAG: hypothetical protein WEF50_04350 [Myxococcota bacterium]
MSAASRRDELARVQALYARLLYCQHSVASYRAAPDRILSRAGLGPEWRPLLPDMVSVNHAAEMRGRRILAVQELEAMFPGTLLLLTGERHDHSDARWVDDYLSSNEFFDPCCSLPHPSGIGRAHEGLTRFFFWLRRCHRLRAVGASIDLRDAAFLEMSHVLNVLRQGARSVWFRRVARGTYWRRIPGRAGVLYVRAPDGEVLEGCGKAMLARLRAMRLLDLDEFEP